MFLCCCTGQAADSDIPTSSIPTLKFNLARVQDACGDSQAAANGYKAVLVEQPGYIDCYLRLSSIARRKGDHRLADSFTSQAMTMEGGHEDALVMMAATRMKARDWSGAKVSGDDDFVANTSL